MPINFPDNPTDNQEFNGYIYDATRGVWDVKLASDPLGSLNLTSPAAGEALVFDGTSWKNQKVSSAESKTIDSDNIAIDFSDGIPLEKRSVAGDVTFTASNYTAGVTKKIFLSNKASRSELVFPSEWSFVEDGSAPSALGPNKKNVLEITSFGTTEAEVVANWLGPSAFEPIIAFGGTETTIDINGVMHKVHTFTQSGPFEVQSAGSLGIAEYLVVGGGGCGGGWGGGGGGAGGVRSSIPGYVSGGGSNAENPLSLIVNNYAIFVGAGGPPDIIATGSPSTFSSVTSLGGGSGGGNISNGWKNALSGGSGGGATWIYDSSNGIAGSGTAVQGYSGGSISFTNSGQHPSAGGGGSAGLGGTPPNNASGGGAGGPGVLINADGFDYYYAAGGGGSVHYESVFAGNGGIGGGGGGSSNSLAKCGSGGISGRNNGGNGTNTNSGGNGGANTGSGGGGGWQSGASNGGAGGSGIVIIRYPITDPN